MSWIIFSLLAALVWGISNVTDKFIFYKWVKSPNLLLMSFGFSGLVAAIIVYFFKGFSHVSILLIFIALINGLFYLLANLLYFKAVQIEEVSRVLPLFYLDPLFTAVLSAIFIGEIFSFTKYLGVAFLVFGAMLISYKKVSGFKLNKAFWFCILGAFLFAICNLLTKYLLRTVDFWTVFAYIRIGSFISLLPMYFVNYKSFWQLAVKQPVGYLVMGFSNLLGLIGILFFLVAASKGYVTLVTSVTAVQILFVFFITLGFGVYWPHILNEESGKKVALQKLLAIILMIVGVILIS